MPADFDVKVLRPSEALPLPKRHGVRHAPHQYERPCEILFATVNAKNTGVPIPQRPHEKLGWRQKASALMFDWAGPHRGVAARTSIPVDVVFERLHLGFIPATALPLIALVLVAICIATLVAPYFLRAYRNVPEFRREKRD